MIACYQSHTSLHKFPSLNEQEEHDEIPSIIDTAPVSKPSSPKRSDRINRRASIERRVAFRRRSTKGMPIIKT